MLLTERIKSLAKPLGMTFASIERDIDIGRGTIRKWDTNCPAADKLLKVANLLNTTTDFLLTGNNHDGHSDYLLEGTHTNATSLSPDDTEWLDLIHRLPEKKQIEFKAKIEGYLECYEESVTADDTLKKTGTDSLGK